MIASPINSTAVDMIATMLDVISEMQSTNVNTYMNTTGMIHTWIYCFSPLQWNKVALTAKGEHYVGAPDVFTATLNTAPEPCFGDHSYGLPKHMGQDIHH